MMGGGRGGRGGGGERGWEEKVKSLRLVESQTLELEKWCWLGVRW